MKANRFKNRKKKKFSLKKYFFIGLFFCLLAGCIYFLFWSPYFWVKDIVVEGYDDLEIKKIVEEKLADSWYGIPQKSIFLIPINQIKKDILDKYSKIKDVIITRQLPDDLKIEIQEREKVGLWCQIKYEEKKELATSTEEVIKLEREINQCFYFDSEGIIFQKAPQISGSLVLNIYGTKNPVEIRDKVIPQETIEFILEIKENISAMISALESFEIINAKDIRATTVQGWQIYFNPDYSAESQLKTLRLVIEKEIKNTSYLEYLDLRIDNRVYYKNQESGLIEL